MIVNVYGYAPIIASSLTAYTSSDTDHVQKITAIADVAGSLNNKYFILPTANCTTIYVVWFNINSAGTQPKIGSNVTYVEITGATNVTNLTLGASMRTDLGALTEFTASGTGADCTLTDGTSGAAPIAHDDPNDSTTSTGFTFAETTPGTNAVPSNLFYEIVGKIMVDKVAFDASNTGTLSNIKYASEDITLIVPVQQILSITEN